MQIRIKAILKTKEKRILEIECNQNLKAQFSNDQSNTNLGKPPNTHAKPEYENDSDADDSKRDRKIKKSKMLYLLAYYCTYL